MPARELSASEVVKILKAHEMSKTIHHCQVISIYGN